MCFPQALSGYCGFMAANLYARSIFGEDALANVSIEKPIHLGPEAPVTGHIRIRAKSQVMGLAILTGFRTMYQALPKMYRFCTVSSPAVLPSNRPFRQDFPVLSTVLQIGCCILFAFK